MKFFRKTGLKRLGMIPLLTPIMFCSALFLVATQGLNLPSRNWAMLVVVFGVIWYLLLSLGMRHVGIEGRDGNSEVRRSDRSTVSSFGLARVLRSPGGLLSATLGVGLVLSGNLQLGAVLLGVGMLLVSLSLIWRR